MTEGSVVLGNHTQITTIIGEVKYIQLTNGMSTFERTDIAAIGLTIALYSCDCIALLCVTAALSS